MFTIDCTSVRNVTGGTAAPEMELALAIMLQQFHATLARASGDGDVTKMVQLLIAWKSGDKDAMITAATGGKLSSSSKDEKEKKKA